MSFDVHKTLVGISWTKEKRWSHFAGVLIMNSLSLWKGKCYQIQQQFYIHQVSWFLINQEEKKHTSKRWACLYEPFCEVSNKWPLASPSTSIWQRCPTKTKLFAMIGQWILWIVALDWFSRQNRRDVDNDFLQMNIGTGHHQGSLHCIQSRLEFRQSLKDVPSRCWGCGYWDQDLRLAMIDLPYNLTKWHGLSQFHNIIEQIYSIYYTCIYCNIHQRERSVKGHMYFALSIDSVASESVTYILPVCNLNFI